MYAITCYYRNYTSKQNLIIEKREESSSHNGYDIDVAHLISTILSCPKKMKINYRLQMKSTPLLILCPVNFRIILT